jgi:HK97 family phage portal protein
MNIFSTIKKSFSRGQSRTIGGLFGWINQNDWSKRTLLKQYTRYVYPIIAAVAEESAKADFFLERNDKPISSHPLMDLLKTPNPDTSQFQFLEAHFTYMKLAGESFWYLAKGEKSLKPKLMYLLRPDMVEVAIDEKANVPVVKGYVLTDDKGNKTTLEPNEVIHFRMPNPTNPFRGLGPVEAGKIYIQTEESGSVWTRNALNNAGRPSGILSLKGVITDDDFSQLKKEFKQNYTGSENAGKTMLLKGTDGLDYQKMGMELGEVALKEMKDMTRDDIMVMFRVSKTMLGISDDVNRANAREGKQVFIENIIKPELDRFIDQVNSKLAPMFEKGLTLYYKDPATISEQEMMKEWEIGHNKWLTTNDIRFEKGLDPIEGGDVIYQPLNLVPMSETPAILTPQKKVKKQLTRHEKGEIFRKTLFTQADQWSSKYENELKKEFDIQRKEIFRQNKSLTKTFASWLFDQKESKARLLKVLTPISYAFMKEQSKLAFDIAGDNETQFEIDASVRDYVTERIDRFADTVNDETIKQIEGTLAQGMEQGESVYKLKKRISEVYTEAKGYRAERIARTEAIASSNESANQSYRQSPLVNGKEWLTEPDACEFCIPMNGKIVGLSENFSELNQTLEGVDGGIMTTDYTEIVHPPLHPNCRCTILPVADIPKSVKYKEVEEDIEKAKKEFEEMKAKELIKIKKEKSKIKKQQKKLKKELKDIEKLYETQ